MDDAIRSILVGIDGSPGAARAARLAGTLARATGAGVVLMLVHDTDLYVVSGPGEAAWISAGEYEELQAQFTEQLRAGVTVPALQAAREALGALPVQAAEVVEWGHPAESLAAYARQHGVDLIVVGTRGRSVFSELLLGSVSAQLVHHAPCPVTVVR